MSVETGIDVDGAEELSALLSGEDVGGSVEFSVYTNVYYAGYNEMGTSKMAAQPFMRPALHSVSTSWRSYIASNDTVDDAIEEMANDIQDRAEAMAPVRTGRLESSIEVEEL